MNTRENAVAVCGIDCFYCEFYGENLTEELQKMLAAIQKIDFADVKPCKGCREQKGCLIHPVCDTYECVKEKDVNFCYECSEFPCTFLHPSADRAEKLPHNLKVYNLSRIKAVGIAKWIEDESLLSKKKYYKGKIIIGSGPQLEK